jgi:uncharacterized protein (DUF58 family)
MDLSQSMGYTLRQELNKFEYAICLAAALCYLMINQQDPVGLVTFDKQMRDFLKPKSKRTQLATILSHLARLQPAGETDIAHSLVQLGAMLKQQSLIMIFSDLLVDEPPLVQSMLRLRHGGHDIILFHILDEAEVIFPFDGPVRLEDPESTVSLEVDGTSFRSEYRDQIRAYRDRLKQMCYKSGIDYVPLDTSMPFDRALTEYLLSRRARF